MNSKVEKFVLSYVKDQGTKCIMLLSDGTELELSLNRKEEQCPKKPISRKM